MRGMSAVEGGRGPGSPQSEATLAHSSLPQGRDTVQRNCSLHIITFMHPVTIHALTKMCNGCSCGLLNNSAGGLRSTTPPSISLLPSIS